MMKLKTGRRECCIPSGAYKAIVEDIKLSKVFKRPAFIFHFRIVEGEHNDIELRGFCNGDYEKYSSRTKLWRWYEKATGAEFEPDLEIDTEDFKEKVLRVQVATRTSRKTGNEFSNVIEIEGLEHDLL